VAGRAIEWHHTGPARGIAQHSTANNWFVRALHFYCMDMDVDMDRDVGVDMDGVGDLCRVGHSLSPPKQHN